MGKQTKEYRELSKRIRLLKKHFDFKQGKSGLTPLQEDRVRGFCLLSHAEFEDYFESIAKRIFEESSREWKTKKKANFQMASFFVLCDPSRHSGDAFTRSCGMLLTYQDKLDGNNGIKEGNIESLYKPLRYRLDDFDPCFRSELNYFGSLRGENAHKSGNHTTTMLNKVDEFARVDRLLTMIVDFESVIKQKYANL